MWNNEKIEISYRNSFKDISLKRIKLEIPGWAGEKGYKDGCIPQAWHCKPFTEASTYGVELIYSFKNEFIVKTSEDNIISFEGEFTEEEKLDGYPIPPFSTFAPNHYGFTSSFDIQTPKNIITRIEPHPCYFTDRTGTIPLPIPGHLESEWWSKIFFIVFAAPLPGKYHVFKPGKPYAQLLFLPKKIEYDIQPMNDQDYIKRIQRDQNISTHGYKLCNRRYTDYLGNTFDNKYKTMSKINEKLGDEEVDKFIQEKGLQSITLNKKISAFRLKKKKNESI